MSKIGLVAAGTIALSGCAPAHSDTPPATTESVAVPSLKDAPPAYFTSNNVRIRYKDIGRGDAVLLLHGWTDRAEMWAGPADTLAERYRVIVPDLRGFGESSKPADPNEYGRSWGSDMLALLDHLGLQSAHVIGYSMGALIASQLALDDPQRVRTVTLVAGPFFRDSATFAEITRPLIASLEAGNGLGAFFRWQMPTWSDSAIASIVQPIYEANDHAALVATMTALATLMPDPARVAQSSVPAFVIVSKLDQVAGSARYIAGLWPNARLTITDTFDHSDIHLAPQLLDGFYTLVQSDNR